MYRARLKTEPPCTTAELPEIDIVVISHNHYDHTDVPTLRELYAKQSSRPPALFLPLNTMRSLKSIGVPESLVTELDWWDDRQVQVDGKGDVTITCSGLDSVRG